MCNNYKVEKMDSSVAYDNLLSHEIKPSVQRIAIMDYMMTHLTHPSVDEIYNDLSPLYPTLSRTTVYNTLKLFVEHNAVQMLTIDERNACFDGDMSPHAHFLCKKCGKIYDLPLRKEDAQWVGQEVDGNEILEMHQYFKGICRDCK